MSPITREWVEYAEADYAAALLIRRSRKRQSRQIVSFHLQQCLEKYLKARLIEAGIKFPMTHDLEELLDQVVPLEPLWAAYRSALSVVTIHAVRSRYPGRPVSAKDLNEVVKVTTQVRMLIRNSLGLR